MPGDVSLHQLANILQEYLRNADQKTDPERLVNDSCLVVKLKYPCNGVDRLTVNSIDIVRVPDDPGGREFHIHLCVDSTTHLKCQLARET